MLTFACLRMYRLVTEHREIVNNGLHQAEGVYGGRFVESSRGKLQYSIVEATLITLYIALDFPVVFVTMTRNHAYLLQYLAC